VRILTSFELPLNGLIAYQNSNALKANCTPHPADIIFLLGKYVHPFEFLQKFQGWMYDSGLLSPQNKDLLIEM
jgi:hypothetical protein